MDASSVLIVEDDGIQILYLEGLLTRLGYTVLPPVSTGEEAVQSVRNQPPSIILMDIELGGKMNGITAAEQITTDIDIPIIFLTGFSQDPLLQIAKLTAPYGYLVKPVPDSELAAAIELSLYRHKLDLQIKESEAKYRKLFQNLFIGFALHEIILNPSGKPVDYRFLEVNPAFENLTGLHTEDLIGHTVLDILPKTEAFWIETYGRVALTEESIQFQYFSTSLQRNYEVVAYCPQPGQFVTVFIVITGNGGISHG